MWHFLTLNFINQKWRKSLPTNLKSFAVDMSSFHILVKLVINDEILIFCCTKEWNFPLGMTQLFSSNLFAKISIILSFILEGSVVSKSNTTYKVDSDMYWCVILCFFGLCSGVVRAFLGTLLCWGVFYADKFGFMDCTMI